MSEKDNNETALPDDAALVEDVAPESEPKPKPESKPESKPEPEPLPGSVTQKSGAGVAWLALLVSIIALIAVGYTEFQDWRAERAVLTTADPFADLRRHIASSGEALENIDTALADLESSNAGVAGQLEFLQQDIENRLQLLDSLPPRMSNLESSVAALQGVSTGARDTWLLAETEYYMQIANAQLQLAGNPHLAANALRMADDRISQLADPALTDVRRAIADELAALDGMERPDIEGTTLTLASLARVVEALPLRQASAAAAEEEEISDPELSGVDRAWASVKGAVSGLVKVSGPDEGAMPLMTPEAVYFLRTNLTLQLQAARLALLRGEQAVFQQSLDDAAAWIEAYFDAGSTQVTSALQTIEEIRGGMVATPKPDISGSLRSLRQFRTLTESAQ